MRNASELGLIGHARTWELLSRLLDRQRLPTAVLLVGPPSVGKRTLAQHVIARVLGGEATVAHPDVLRIQSPDDAVLRAQLVKLLQHVHTRPVRATSRAVLLPEVDRTSPAAASLLLKTIEDAPPYAKFFLTATARDRVAPTVRSRVLSLEVRPVPQAELRRGLEARGLSEDVAESCARLSGGRPGLALRLSSDAELQTRYRAWETLIRRGPTSPASAGRGEGSQRAHPRRGGRAVAGTEDARAAEEFLTFLQGCCREGLPPPRLLRRVREGLAMLRQHVPAGFVVEYVLDSLA